MLYYIFSVFILQAVFSGLWPVCGEKDIQKNGRRKKISISGGDFSNRLQRETDGIKKIYARLFCVAFIRKNRRSRTSSFGGKAILLLFADHIMEIM
ncbi:MAG: hypothetical protein HFI93_08150 [Lachnospiraceae bacterium]|nr:hypothetical protein [Lachnospiraceae bacterium]